MHLNEKHPTLGLGISWFHPPFLSSSLTQPHECLGPFDIFIPALVFFSFLYVDTHFVGLPSALVWVQADEQLVRAKPSDVLGLPTQAFAELHLTRYPRTMAFRLFGLGHLCSQKPRIPRSFRVCGLCLPALTLLEIKTKNGKHKNTQAEVSRGTIPSRGVWRTLPSACERVRVRRASRVFVLSWKQLWPCGPPARVWGALRGPWGTPREVV